jgi:hypothetical protein
MQSKSWCSRAAVFLAGLLAGCSSSGQSGSPGLPEEVKAVVFMQRMALSNAGNVFDYTSYEPGGRIVKLEPPAANGKLTVLTSDPMWDGADFMAWDLSFDAKSIVFAARLKSDAHYQIFSMNLDGTNIRQLTEGDVDHVYPVYLPGQKIFFTTNESVEEGAKQFEDEYERQTTAQVGIMSEDGSNVVLGPRNVSHRVSPTLMPDGRVLYTEWRHLGMVNDGHLRLMNTDMTNMKEAFGGEEGATNGTNSYLKARFVSTYTTPTGSEAYRIVAVGTSRDRTLQSGKVLLISLDKSEKTSSFEDLTPQVPGDRTPSDYGRFYDAEPVGSADDKRFLVSWSDGPVESERLAMGATKAQFGLYVLDGKTGNKFPVYDDPNYWDVQARPIKARPEPPVTAGSIQGDGDFLVSAINVYDSSLVAIPKEDANHQPYVVKVRLMEGFSGEEGPRTFGTTEFDGHSLFGEVPVAADGSFAARVPANVPVHMQLLDKFAVSVANEPVWVSGRPGENRTCGGCHEDRTKQPQLAPGQLDSILSGAVNLVAPRAARVSTDYSYGKIRGVPWDKAIQPIFDAKCVSCHDGTPSAANPQFSITDNTTGLSQTFTFDLRGQKVAVTIGEKPTNDFTASYLSIMGLGEIVGENKVTYTGMPFKFANAADAAGSEVIRKLNPPQQFPAVDMSVRRFPTATHAAMVGGPELTAEEYYRLILNIDMGGQFFFRENADEAMGYMP